MLSALRFGWNLQTHHAIESAGVACLPDSPWKDFLQAQLPDIHLASAQQDLAHRGEKHLLYLEQLDQPNNTKLPETERTFPVVAEQFSLKRQAEAQQAFNSRPLISRRLEAKPNAFSEAKARYQEVVTLLRKGTLTRTNPDTIRQLSTALGAMAHYVADMLQPMHTSAYYYWFTPASSEKNAHRFFERSLFSAPEVDIWQEALVRQGLSPRNPVQTVWARLAESAQDSYFKLFQVVQAEVNARRMFVNNPPAFEAALKKAWRPIAQAQMTLAVGYINELLAQADAEAEQKAEAQE